MTNRFMIISLVFFVSKAGFAGNYQAAPMDYPDNEHSPQDLLQEWEQEQHQKWEEETRKAASEIRVPNSSRQILEALHLKIIDFSWKKERELNSKEDLAKHAQSILFSMTAYNNISWNTIGAAVDPTGRGETIDYENIAYWYAYKAAWGAAKGCTAGSDAFRASIDVADRAHHLKNILRSGCTICFQEAEQAVPLYFLNHFNEIVSASYEASMNKLSNVTDLNIFYSKVEWDEFKEKYFGELKKFKPKSYQFLAPWVAKVDWIIETIENLPSDPQKSISQIQKNQYAKEEIEHAKEIARHDWEQEQHQKCEEKTTKAASEIMVPISSQQIFEALHSKIKDFSRKKELELNSKEDLAKHAQSILFSMAAYSNIYWKTLGDAVDPTGRGEPIYYRNMAYWYAYKAAWDAAEGCTAGRAATGTFGECTARKAAFRASIDAADPGHHLKNVLRSGCTISSQEAEQIVPLYFLNHFDEIVSASYEASMNKLSNVTHLNIFYSIDKWDEFIEKYFGYLIMHKPESYYFLSSWVLSVHLIVKKIENLPRDPQKSISHIQKNQYAEEEIEHAKEIARHEMNNPTSFTPSVIDGPNGLVLQCPECKTITGTLCIFTHHFDCPYKYIKPTRGKNR